jgi:hypothetical protein
VVVVGAVVTLLAGGDLPFQLAEPGMPNKCFKKKGP